MPIPKPRKNENKNEFISRCMSDTVMKKEYPNQKQRNAVCFTAWDDKDKNKDSKKK